MNLLPTVRLDWLQTVGSNGCCTHFFAVRSDSRDQIIRCERTIPQISAQNQSGYENLLLQNLLMTKPTLPSQQQMPVVNRSINLYQPKIVPTRVEKLLYSYRSFVVLAPSYFLGINFYK